MKKNPYFNIHQQIIAHRGGSAYAPENTASAIKKAAKMGLNWIEVDVAISADEQPVIFHDSHLERCSNGSGKLVETSYQQLQHLDFGAWFAPSYAKEPILTLTELLDLALQQHLSLNLEIKPEQGYEQATIHAIVQCLQAYTKLPHLLFSSFSIKSLMLIKKSLAQHPRAVLVEEIHSDCIPLLKEVNASGLHFDAAKNTEEKIKKMLTQNMPLLAYTVNNPQTAQRLFNLGITAVFSDYPDLLIGKKKAEND